MNKDLNRGRSKKAENKRLCRELLRKGNSQRQIAKILNISLQTTNKYCQEIAKEIEDAQKAEETKLSEARIKAKTRKARMKAIKEEVQTIEAVQEVKTPEQLAQEGFTACLMELKLRLPSMTNEEVCKITVDLWDRVSK